MIFVDASAFVAIIAREPGYGSLALALEAEESLVCSAVSIWETVAALVRSHRYSVASATAVVGGYIHDLGMRYVPIEARENELAIAAFERFGKGRHQAALNMGDCFASACAKANGVKLLFKGGDFALTDVDAA